MPADLTEAVRAAQTGDEEAFRSLYRAVQPGLLRYLTALVGADAEDVASETWLQISRDLRSFEGGPAFRAWAATIARNRALDHLRHHSRRPAQPVPAATLIDLPSGDDTAERADEQIATDAAIALIATLPQTEAEAVLLRTVVGLDAKAAGRVLGKRAGAVRIAAHRGLRRLARMLEQTEPPDPQTEPPDPISRIGWADRRAGLGRLGQVGRSRQAGGIAQPERASPGQHSTPTDGDDGRADQSLRSERNLWTEQGGRVGEPERVRPPRGGQGRVERAEDAVPGRQNRRPEWADFAPVRTNPGSTISAGPAMAPRAAWFNRLPAVDRWSGRGWE